jgi:hypothetical protein
MNPAQKSIPSGFPDGYEFYYGSFSGKSLYVRIGNKESLVIERTQGGNFDGVPAIAHPSEKEWLAFRNALDAIGVWDWESEYRTGHGCSGVTYWHLSLK